MLIHHLIRANKDIWTDWQSCITMGPFSSSDKGLKPRNLRIVVGHPLQSFVLEQVQVLLGCRFRNSARSHWITVRKGTNWLATGRANMWLINWHSLPPLHLSRLPCTLRSCLLDNRYVFIMSDKIFRFVLGSRIAPCWDGGLMMANHDGKLANLLSSSSWHFNLTLPFICHWFWLSLLFSYICRSVWWWRVCVCVSSDG